jgi:hypothetical protein
VRRASRYAQRVDLTAAPVESEHQLRAWPLAKGVLSHERFELRDDILVVSEREFAVDQIQDCAQPLLVQLGHLVARERLERHV